MKKIFVLSAIALLLFSVYPNISRSATPFSVPADFDLAGSEIQFSVSFESQALGSVTALLLRHLHGDKNGRIGESFGGSGVLMGNQTLPNKIGQRGDCLNKI